MEKQSLRFFVLRALLLRLQRWTDLLSQYIGEEAHLAVYEPVHASEDVIMVKESDPAPLAALSIAEVEDAYSDAPPSHWLALISDDEPPAHWRVRVQKYAPELLEQPGRVKTTVEGPSLPSPRKQTESGELPVEMPQNILDAQELQEVRSVQEGESIPTSKVIDDPGKRSSGEDRKQSAAMVPPSIPATVQAHGPIVREETRDRQPGTMKFSAELGSWQDEESVVARQHNETIASTGHEALVKLHELERVETGKEPISSSESRIAPPSSVEGRPALHPRNGDAGSDQAPPSSIARRDRPKQEVSWQKQMGDDLERPEGETSQWPMYITSSERRLLQLDESSELKEGKRQLQTDPRWPTLPEEERADPYNWEMAWRNWERQRRLDEEQRGETWNA